MMEVHSEINMSQREIKVFRGFDKSKLFLCLEFDGVIRFSNTNSIRKLAKAMVRENLDINITDLFVGEPAKYCYISANPSDAVTPDELFSLNNYYWAYKTRYLKKQAHC